MALALVMGLAQVSLAWDPLTDPALIAWWKCDEGQGNVVSDSSPNKHDGTFVEGSPSWTTGFRGNGYAIKLAYPTLVEVPAINMKLKQATMAGWVLPSGTQSDWASFIMNRTSSAHGFNLLGSRQLAYHWNDDSASWSYRGTAYYAADEWTHCAVTIEPTKATFYINGVAASTNTIAHAEANWDGPIWLGGDRTYTDGTRHLNGAIDEIMFFSRALTAAEIKSLVPPQVKARKPSPADGAAGVMMPLFTWTPGELSLFEDVYLGTTPELTAANRVSTHQSIMFKMYYHIAPPLVPGQKYYWRIDGIDQAGNVYTGDVWSATMMPVAAWTPVPANGAQYQVVDVNLAWMPGQSAATHEVYFGTSKDDVTNGAAGVSKGSVSVLTLDPGPLANATTYYWRVDEVTIGGQKTAGEVWSFSTRPAIAKTDNLMGWWKLEDENSGTAVDYSGWNRDGTLMGNPKWVDGYQGGAMEFDGQDDYVDTNYSENLASWTVCTWVTSPQAPAATSPTGPVHREMNYQINWNHGDPVFRGGAAMCIGGTWYAASFGNLSASTWYHLTATYDDTGLKAYVNGELITTNATPKGATDAESNTLKFARHAAAAQFFAGTVDDVRVYDRALTQDEIKETMRGDPLLAWDPRPMAGVTADIRDAATLTWEAGETAAKHDVYIGKDKAAVKAADTSSPEYMGRQAGTSYSTAGVVEFGGGAYFWRIDEVEADGTTVHKGSVWSFTVPDFLLIDDFESYGNASPNRLFQTWIDGWGFSEDEFFPTGNPGNGTGATVGHDIWTAGTPYTNIVETSTVRPGSKQSMPLDYDNSSNPFKSEAERTWTSPQDLTASGVSVLSLQVYGYRVMTTTAVSETGGKMSLTGDGLDIWNTSDEFTFAYKTLNGDGALIAKVVSNGTGTNTWAKGGVMIRDSLNGNSAHAMQVITGGAGNGAAFQNRATTGLNQGANDATSNANAASLVTVPYWIKIERFGNTLTGYISSDGTAWVAPNSVEIEMTDPVYIGLCVTSGARGVNRTYQFEGIKSTGGVSGQWQGAIINSPKYNSPQDFYVLLQDSLGKSKAVSNAAAVNSGDWLDVQIPLSQFTGVNAGKIKKMIIGVGNQASPAADGSGSLFIDDIRVIKPTP
jgi:hypothetical protein